jgi:hypothetical protein
MLGLESTLPVTYYGANPPAPYCDACRAGLYPQGGFCGCPACHAQRVGALPPPSTESPQAQVSDQLSTKVLVIGVLAALAAGAIIYSGRKTR